MQQMEDFQPFTKQEEEAHLKTILKWFIVFLFVIGAISLLKNNRNLFFILLSTLIVIIFAILGIVSKKNKIKALLLFGAASFFFLHLLIFPLIYSFLLKNDSNCIIINKEILSNEKSNALSELTNRFTPDVKSERIKLIDKLLLNLKKSTDTTINYLNQNIILLDSFFIARKDTFIRTGNEPGNGINEQAILIFSNDGHLITSLHESSLYKFYSKKIRLSEYLIKFRDFYKEKVESYMLEKEGITTKNNIWSYTRILPYSINIFTTDHFKPISRSANIIYNIHYYLVWGIILTLIFSTMIDLLAIKFKK
jgi:hypothetical protein